MTLLKSIVVCLALANVGYFLWASGIAHPPAASAPAASTATLRLASEARGGPRAAPGSGDAVDSDAATATGGLVGASGGAGGGAGAAAAAGGSAGASGAGAGAGGVAAGGGGGAGGASGGAADAAPQAQGSPGLLTNVKRCISVGPFRDVSEAAHAASTLRSTGYDPRQRVAEGEVWAGVWVYLPIPPSKSSEQMLTKLKAGGIEDALEMPGPNEGSVISLGLYGDAKRAQLRIAQVQSLGFNPGIADRKRTGDVYWIDIDLNPTDSVLKPSDLESEAGRIVRLEVKGCPAAAAAP